MKKKYESATAFLRRKHPFVKAVLDYSLGIIAREFRVVVMVALMAGGFTFNSCRHDETAKQTQQALTGLTNAVMNLMFNP